MNQNTVFIVNLILRIIGGVAVAGMGTYLILHNHTTAGGWTIVAGVFLAGISYSSKGDD